MMKTITRYHFSCPYDFIKKGQKKKNKQTLISGDIIWNFGKSQSIKNVFNTIL